MKKLLLFCMALCFFLVDGLAQNFDETKLETLTNEFIQKANSSEALSLLTSVKSYYVALSGESKSKLRSYYVNKIMFLLEREQKDEALTIIFLYQNLVDAKDDKLPTLLYIKGTIYAEKKDSIRLKQTINELNNELYRDKKEVTEYMSILNVKMDRIMNSVPSYTKLNGIWVADNLYWKNVNNNLRLPQNHKHSPDIVMSVNYEKKADTMQCSIDRRSFLFEQRGTSAGNSFLNTGNNIFKKTKDFGSQIVIPYTTDSIYVLWSSEKINTSGVGWSTFMRGTISATSAAINAELAQKHKYNFSDQFLGNTMSTIAEIGLNSIIDVLFVPSKKMFVLEARLKIENDYLMRGTLTFKYNKVNAEGNSEHEEWHSKVTFARWMPESNVCFWGEADGEGSLFLHPSLSIKPKEYKKDKSTRFMYWWENVAKRFLFVGQAQRAFNNDQYKWLMLYNDSILRNQGFHGIFAINGQVRPFIGIEYSSLDEERQKKTKLTEGVLVKEVYELSAAFVGGLKKGDIILSINNQKLKDKFDMDMIRYSMKPGDWLRMSVLRGKKEIELLIRVTWM